MSNDKKTGNSISISRKRQLDGCPGKSPYHDGYSGHGGGFSLRALVMGISSFCFDDGQSFFNCHNTITHQGINFNGRQRKNFNTHFLNSLYKEKD
ncbi:MAG: hypothetical protein GY950_23965 [bacterium]|nr:hypothetical protein [bacterium]